LPAANNLPVIFSYRDLCHSLLQQLAVLFMDPKVISIADFSYTLPDDRIAAYPLAERDASKILIYRDKEIKEDIYRHISEHIPERSFLVFNNTKVIEARLLFQKPSGGIIEIFCLEPHQQYHDISSAMHQQEKVWWHCLIGGASKWKHGQVLRKTIITSQHEIRLQAVFIEKITDSFVVELSWDPPQLSFAEVLHHAGAIPLPPYIRRKTEIIDTDRYQTIYAAPEGSVAAPTAGLHFTKEVFESMAAKNIGKSFVTLHVGAGTFKPVKAETIGQHEMHAEFIEVSAGTIEHLLKKSNEVIIPVGTTSLRTLESIYWLGVKLLSPRKKELTENETGWKLGQWESFELASSAVPVEEALNALLEYLKENRRDSLMAKTSIIITPGYQTKMAHALITNFHQPQSTLLLLIASLVGEDWKKIYEYALKNNFRFLSYGDGCLLWANKH
jgi:S-adenosylmethionine:tRNA ribosyltransferase-isomerase